MMVDRKKLFVRVLIHDSDGRVLIVANKGKRGGKWNFPGGKVEFGESPETAARREILEETGLSIGDLHLLFEDHFELGSTQWHGYFYEAKPNESAAYNMEPHKLSRVEFVELPLAIERGSRSFLVNVLQRWVTETGYGQPWQMQLKLEGRSKKSSENSA